MRTHRFARVRRRPSAPLKEDGESKLVSNLNPYHNLPVNQRFTQRLVDQFNADERLWKKLEPRRRARRKLLRWLLSRKELKKLDVQEFARERPPLECVGQWVIGNRPSQGLGPIATTR